MRASTGSTKVRPVEVFPPLQSTETEKKSHRLKNLALKTRFFWFFRFWVRQKGVRYILPERRPPALLCAAVVVTALSLNEISASKPVVTPGTLTFTQELFQRMHSGVTQDVSALCLLLLFVIALAGLEAGLRWRVLNQRA